MNETNRCELCGMNHSPDLNGLVPTLRDWFREEHRIARIQRRISAARVHEKMAIDE